MTHLPDKALKQARIWKVLCWVSIIGLAPAVIGFATTIVKLTQAFNSLSTSGGGKPEEFAAAISDAIASTIIGASISSVFVILLIISLIALRRLKSSLQS